MKVTPENAIDIIPAGYKIKVKHFHEGNDPTGLHRKFNGRKRSYATVANVIDVEAEKIVATGKSYCSNNDTPDRRRGWQIAAGRAVAAFNKVRHDPECLRLVSKDKSENVVSQASMKGV